MLPRLRTSKLGESDFCGISSVGIAKSRSNCSFSAKCLILDSLSPIKAINLCTAALRSQNGSKKFCYKCIRYGSEASFQNYQNIHAKSVKIHNIQSSQPCS